MKTTINVVPTAEDGQLCTDNPIANALRAVVGLPRANLKTCRRIQGMAQPSRLFARNEGKMIKEWTTPEVRDWLVRWYDTMDCGAISFDVDVVPAAEVNAGWLIPNGERYGNG